MLNNLRFNVLPQLQIVEDKTYLGLVLLPRTTGRRLGANPVVADRKSVTSLISPPAMYSHLLSLDWLREGIMQAPCQSVYSLFRKELRAFRRRRDTF